MSSDRLSDAELAEIDERHVQMHPSSASPGICAACYTRWPCTIADLIGHIRVLDIENEELMDDYGHERTTEVVDE